MINHLEVMLFSVGLLILNQCSAKNPAGLAPDPRQLTANETKLVTSGNQFGVNLFKAVATEDANKNVFISPLSVSMALGMALNGAAGDTRTEMENTLALQGLTREEINQSYKSLIRLLQGLDPKVVFRIANSIWYRQEMSFKKTFIDLNQNYFNAEVRALDFGNPSSVGIINHWVDNQTNGKIKEIIQQISPSDIMFLINAIYFKGTWTYKFDPEKTTQEDFHTSAGTTEPVQMMSQGGRFLYQENSEFQAVDLPYGNGDFRMMIVLPKSGQDLSLMTGKMNSQTLNGWLNGFSEQEGTIKFPRFEMSYEIELNKVLEALGMNSAFSPQQADFKNMYEGSENAYISQVLHKTYVKVDEEGTEAAAVTSVTVGITSVGQRFFMQVNRPFMFIIHDSRSQSILFIGRILSPVSDG